MAYAPFTQRVIDIIKAIPHGKVSTYGAIAALAGSRRAARQVVRVLHTCSRKEGLPWHRVINKQGKIALDEFQGYDRQKDLLKREGIMLDEQNCVDLERHLWRPGD